MKAIKVVVDRINWRRMAEAEARYKALHSEGTRQAIITFDLYHYSQLASKIEALDSFVKDSQFGNDERNIGYASHALKDVDSELSDFLFGFAKNNNKHYITLGNLLHEKLTEIEGKIKPGVAA